jgi:hypothetical protein
VRISELVESFPRLAAIVGGLERRKISGKEITRSAPAAKCPHGDDGWGEFVRSADPAADQRQRRPKDCTAPSFSSHHEAACPDLEEKQEPRVASSAEAKKGNGMR